jgi:mannose-6-phosphate isomerase-like protein (cupin superfamily)
MKQGKVWGTTTPLLRTPTIEVHLINIKPNSYCSLHCHQFKWNSFFVIHGALETVVEKNDYNLTDVTTLYENQFTTVKPGEYHFFRSSYAPVSALEIYYLESLSEDIIRKNCGGLIDETN